MKKMFAFFVALFTALIVFNACDDRKIDGITDQGDFDKFMKTNVVPSWDDEFDNLSKWNKDIYYYTYSANWQYPAPGQPPGVFHPNQINNFPADYYIPKDSFQIYWNNQNPTKPIDSIIAVSMVHPSCVGVTNGELIISSANDYKHKHRYKNDSVTVDFVTGNACTLIDTFGYGYYEISAKVPGYPPGKPYVSAFWLIDERTEWKDEIDVFEESGWATNSYSTNFHVYPNGVHKDSLLDIPLNMNLWENYHTYGLYWGPGTILWFIDNKLIRSYSGTLVPDATKKMKIILSVHMPDGRATAQDIINCKTQNPPYDLFKISYVRKYNSIPFEVRSLLDNTSYPAVRLPYYNGQYNVWVPGKYSKQTLTNGYRITSFNCFPSGYNAGPTFINNLKANFFPTNPANTYYKWYTNGVYRGTTSYNYFQPDWPSYVSPNDMSYQVELWVNNKLAAKDSSHYQLRISPQNCEYEQ